MRSVLNILLFGMFFLCTGCVTLYKPNAIHSPLLKEKGELSTSASLGMSGCGLYNLQAAYAISNHIGVMIDGMYDQRHLNSVDSSIEKLNIFFGEAGIGYFNTFGDLKKGLFQFYGGGGYGSTSDKISNANQTNPEVNAEYFNIFFQPGLALTNNNFEIAFDLRVNYIQLYNIHAYLYNKFEWWNTNSQFYSNTSLDFINLEPAFTMKAGGKNLKGLLQFGVTVPTINSASYFSVNTSSMLGLPLIKFSVGINYVFGKK